MIPAHRYGSVLWTLDAAIQRHIAEITEGLTAPRGDETAEFLHEAFDWLRARLTSGRDPWRSKGIWQLDGPRKTPQGGEKLLARELSAKWPGLFCEVPAASGVIDWQGHQNRHANVDLVREIGPAEAYELIELKLGSDTPEYATVELLRNALLYLLARNYAPELLRDTRPILQASRIGLRVWAPAGFYAGFDGRCLERAISQGFAAFTSGLVTDFAFEAIDKTAAGPAPVDWACAMRQQRDPIPHVAGPFRNWLREKHADSPRPMIFDPSWCDLIPGRKHRGFDAPDSSQAFALNLFAPLALDPELAARVADRLRPGVVTAGQTATVRFEQSFPDAARLLNERGISTQVDVVFELGGGRKLLIEVKLAEEHFGSCKGWYDSSHPPSRNPDRARCCKVLCDPAKLCYMAEAFGRTYWTYLQPLLPPMHEDEPCPFRGSLYQMMRNYLSARLTGQAEFVACLHPGNAELRMLHQPVLGHRDAVEAFRAVLGEDAVRVWNAREVIEETAALGNELREWRQWMLSHYFED